MCSSWTSNRSKVKSSCRTIKIRQKNRRADFVSAVAKMATKMTRNKRIKAKSKMRPKRGLLTIRPRKSQKRKYCARATSLARFLSCITVCAQRQFKPKSIAIWENCRKSGTKRSSSRNLKLLRKLRREFMSTTTKCCDLSNDRSVRCPISKTLPRETLSQSFST